MELREAACARGGIIHVGQTLSSIHYARQRAKERTAAQKYKSNVQLRDHFNWTIKRAAAHRDVRVHSLIR